MERMTDLDQEEMEILEAFEAGKLERAVNADELIKRHSEYAAAMLRQDAVASMYTSTRAISAGLRNVLWRKAFRTRCWRRASSTNM